MRLFDSERGVSAAYRGYSESAYSYLNTSARKTEIATRLLLEEWFADYPPQAQPQVRGRFRSTKDSFHLGAFFEIYLHRLLRGMNLRVNVEPTLIGNKARPDFFVTDSKGNGAYIEATTIADETESDPTHDLFDTINQKLSCRNFFLGLRIEGELQRNVRTNRIIRLLGQWLDSQDPDAVYTKLPKMEFELDEDCVLECTLIPRSQGFRDKPARIIGSTPSKSRWGGGEGITRKSLLGKAKEYRNLDFPLIIALNILPWYHTPEDVRLALLGPQLAAVPIVQVEEPFWGNVIQPRRRHVAGVLALNFLLPHTVHLEQPILTHNPWSPRPVSPELLSIIQHLPDPASGSTIKMVGLGAEELLRLPKEWRSIQEGRWDH